MDVPVPSKASAPITVWQKKVLIAQPWQKQTNPVTAFCVAQLIDSRRTASMLHHGDAFVVHSRNSCADAFLKSGLEWMLMVDDDMVIPFGHSQWFQQNTGFNFPEQFMKLHALDRLMSHGKSLVGALYFSRQSGGGPPTYGEGRKELEYAKKAPYDTLKPTRWVGTGCILIHRKVFEDIERMFPRLARNGDKGGQWFTSTEASLFNQVVNIRNGLQGQQLTGMHAVKVLEQIEGALAMAEFENPLGTGEDVSFCLRAKAAGHQPYVDMGLVCGHIGYHVYGPRDSR